MDVGRARSLQQGKSDVWKVPKPQNGMLQQQQEASGPPSSRIKRKLQGVTLDFVSSKIKQGKEKAHREIQSAAARTSQPLLCVKAKEIPPSESSSFAKFMPEKRTLELVLDVLQRRDTYKIFAEPVDPEKVEDYYEIINEPMDFGTMRAKLHEGMYETPEQFEHDVFLISGNAMHFNSSGTVYFRQARAIDDLAKKVFHVLKTDPDNFELEFSRTRRRSGRRRPQGEAKDLNFNSSTRLPKNFRPGTVSNDVSSVGKLSLLTAPSISRRNMRGLPGVAASTGADVDTREYALFSGARDGGRSGSDEADRRSTYTTPWMLFHNNENESVFQKFHSDPKPLLLVNDDVGYRKSLTLFIKGLGPTAQMVAKRKLQGLSRDAPTQQTDCPIQDALSTWETDIMTNRISDQKVVDLLHGNQTILKPTSEIIDLTIPDDGDTTKPGVRDKFSKSTAQASAGSQEVSGLQTTIGFSSFSKMGNSKTRSGTKCQEATSNPTTPSDRHGEMMSHHLQSSSQASHSSSRFTFDMPFLKSQLNQMRVMGGQQDRLLHRMSQRGFSTGTGTGNQDQGQGTLFDPRGYIKVPVHFAESSSSTTFLHKQPH